MASLVESMGVCLTVWHDCKVVSNFIIKVRNRTMDSFLKRPGYFSGAKANFKTKTGWIVPQFLAHKPVNFALLTDTFIISFSKLLEPWSWMQTHKKNSFLGMKSYWGFQGTGPRTKSRNQLKGYWWWENQLSSICWEAVKGTSVINGPKC